MTAPILQERLPFAPWMEGRTWRLPGIVPLEDGAWVLRDEAFAGQMAERDRLIAERLPLVHDLLPEGRGAADELYRAVLEKIAEDAGYLVGGAEVVRPDGVVVPLDPARPLITLGRLVQEDLCLMQARGDEHVLTGAVLCFPASWTLAQKIGRPLTGIHVPVPHYDDGMARRVQRLFDAIRVGQPLMRFNALIYDDPVLHQPRREGEARPRPVEKIYLRSERQVLMRLPETGAVVFSIHTYVVRIDSLSQAERDGLAAVGL